ncbi:MAG: 2,3,4,5-tetrahydropyridine-2,6-dicarboxylate N-acetyltransferase [Clostridiaceae bacterium]
MSNEFLSDAYEIAAYIKNAVKKTPVKLYAKGLIEENDLGGVIDYGHGNTHIIFGEADAVRIILDKYKDNLKDVILECDRRNSAIPLINLTNIDARIEPGSYIREFVTIGKGAVIMMGAVINIGAVIGEGTMVDMNAVVGARGTIGKNCHIGAGAVIAGVLEPPSKTPVIIEDGVLIGANAVVLEGVRIGKNSVIGAGSVVTSDIPPESVATGSPARVVKQKDEKTEEKTKLMEDLR